MNIILRLNEYLKFINPYMTSPYCLITYFSTGTSVENISVLVSASSTACIPRRQSVDPHDEHSKL